MIGGDQIRSQMAQNKAVFTKCTHIKIAHMCKHLHKGTFFYYFLLPIRMTEKVLFLDQIFEIEILIDLYVLRSPDFENLVFSG